MCLNNLYGSTIKIMTTIKRQPLKPIKMKTLKTVTLLIMLALTTTMYAQEKPQMKKMPFHLSFVTPFGTNGMESWNTINNFSINLFGGYSGGLNGFEASGFASVLRSDMKGAQFSGFANADLGKSKGAQFAGFANYNKDEMQGAQFAGFVNTVSSSLNGFQSAGFANYAMGGTMGQLSGFANINVGDLKGAQITGFANVNTGRVKGLQLSGFANITNKLAGTQIGFLNYVDSLESGTPIGFLSFVKNGYRTFEFATSETLHGIASFKTGTRHFYNIISVGGAYRNDQVLWGWGYGVGTLIDLTDKFDLGVELQAFHINEGEWYTANLNMLNKLTVQVAYEVSSNIEVFVSPTFNVVVSDTKDDIGAPTSSSIAPYTVYSNVNSNGYKVEMYPGLTIGVRF